MLHLPTFFLLPLLAIGPVWASHPKTTVEIVPVPIQGSGLVPHLIQLLTNECDPAQTPKNRCLEEPFVAGPCLAAFRKFSWDGSSCKRFTYGGCGGNGNRFKSRAECQQKCDKKRDPCSEKPFVAGRCYARKGRFSWDGTSCKRFYYGGCGGNGNRFETREECLQTCQRRTEPVAKPDGSVDVVSSTNVIYPGQFSVPLATKPDCNPRTVNFTCLLQLHPKYFWDADAQSCNLHYIGCKGFRSLGECIGACAVEDKEDLAVSEPDIKINGKCSAIPFVTGLCKAHIISYSWTGSTCEQFVYGGCGGSDNRFRSKSACLEACQGSISSQISMDAGKCLAKPFVTGPCRAYFPSYSWDGSRCKRFIYGGCSGSSNRFESKSSCLSACQGNSNGAVSTMYDALATRCGDPRLGDPPPHRGDSRFSCSDGCNECSRCRCTLDGRLLIGGLCTKRACAHIPTGIVLDTD